MIWFHYGKIHSRNVAIKYYNLLLDRHVESGNNGHHVMHSNWAHFYYKSYLANAYLMLSYDIDRLASVTLISYKSSS